MADSKQFTFAKRLWDSDDAFRQHVADIKRFSRQQMALEYTVSGRKYTVAPSPRAMALVQMFAAFPEQTPRITVPALVQEDKEDERATNITRFLRGIRRATVYGGIHPDDAVWLHGGEVGRGILYCQFDLDLAKQGLFPFRRKAIDPNTFAFKMSDRGLVCAMISEERDALELYDELMGTYEKVAKNDPAWHVPDVLLRAYRDYDTQIVNVIRFWDREREYMWVEEESVWHTKDEDGQVSEGREHLMGRVPFDIGFVMQMPSDKQEELGAGILKYVLQNLKNDSKLQDKLYLGAEYFFMPLFAGQTQAGKIFFEQVVPGGEGYDNIAKYDIINPQVNAPIIQDLRQTNEVDISLASLSEATMSGAQGAPRMAGYAFSQMNAPVARKNDRLLDSITDMYKSHYGLILWAIQEYANKEKAVEFGILDAELQQNYLKSFTTFSPMVGAKPNSKIKTATTLTSDDVRGYQIVDVDFKPPKPEDANAKYQRAQLSASMKLPIQYILKDVLEVDSPEQVIEWMHEEALMQDPDWRTRMIMMWKRQKLEADKALRTEFQTQDIQSLPPDVAPQVEEMLSKGVPFDVAMEWADKVMQANGQATPQGQNASMVDANGQPLPQGQAGQPPPQGAPQGQPSQGMPPQGMPPQGMMQGQPPQSPAQGDPMQAVQQLLGQLPPELQQVFQDPQVQQMLIQLVQQGIPPDQAIQQILQMLQQQQGQQGGQQGAPQQPSGAFVSPAAMGQAPVSPMQTAGMAGFGG